MNLTQLSNAMEKKSVVISWLRVCEKFYNKYSEVFLCGEAKAHLDSCNKVIETAKVRWKVIVLLDALVCHLNNHELSPLALEQLNRGGAQIDRNLLMQSRGRQFDQQGVLYTAIQECVAESSLASKGSQENGSNAENGDGSSNANVHAKNNKKTAVADSERSRSEMVTLYNSRNVKVSCRFCLTDIEDAWQTLALMRTHLIDTSSSSSSSTSQLSSQQTSSRATGATAHSTVSKRVETFDLMVRGCEALQRASLADSLLQCIIKVASGPPLPHTFPRFDTQQQDVGRNVSPPHQQRLDPDKPTNTVMTAADRPGHSTAAPGQRAGSDDQSGVSSAALGAALSNPLIGHAHMFPPTMTPHSSFHPFTVPLPPAHLPSQSYFPQSEQQLLQFQFQQQQQQQQQQLYMQSLMQQQQPFTNINSGVVSNIGHNSGKNIGNSSSVIGGASPRDSDAALDVIAAVTDRELGATAADNFQRLEDYRRALASNDHARISHYQARRPVPATNVNSSTVTASGAERSGQSGAEPSTFQQQQQQQQQQQFTGSSNFPNGTLPTAPQQMQSHPYGQWFSSGGANQFPQLPPYFTPPMMTMGPLNGYPLQQQQQLWAAQEPFFHPSLLDPFFAHQQMVMLTMQRQQQEQLHYMQMQMRGMLVSQLPADRTADTEASSQNSSSLAINSASSGGSTTDSLASRSDDLHSPPRNLNQLLNSGAQGTSSNSVKAAASTTATASKKKRGTSSFPSPENTAKSASRNAASTRKSGERADTAVRSNIEREKMDSSDVGVAKEPTVSKKKAPKRLRTSEAVGMAGAEAAEQSTVEEDKFAKRKRTRTTVGSSAAATALQSENAERLQQEQEERLQSIESFASMPVSSSSNSKAVGNSKTSRTKSHLPNHDLLAGLQLLSSGGGEAAGVNSGSLGSPAEAPTSRTAVKKRGISDAVVAAANAEGKPQSLVEDEAVSAAATEVVTTTAAVERLSSRGRVIKEIMHIPKASARGDEEQEVKSFVERVLHGHQRATNEARQAAGQAVIARQRRSLEHKVDAEKFKAPTACEKGETCCVSLRVGLTKGDWCDVGRAVGIHADGVGPVSTASLLLGVVLDNYLAPKAPSTATVTTGESSSSANSSTLPPEQTTKSSTPLDRHLDSKSGMLLVSVSGEAAVLLDARDLKDFFAAAEDQLLCVNDAGDVRLLSAQLRLQHQAETSRGTRNSSRDSLSKKASEFKVFGVAMREGSSFVSQVRMGSRGSVTVLGKVEPLCCVKRLHSGSAYSLDFRCPAKEVNEQEGGASESVDLSTWARVNRQRANALFPSSAATDKDDEVTAQEQQAGDQRHMFRYTQVAGAVVATSGPEGSTSSSIRRRPSRRHASSSAASPKESSETVDLMLVKGVRVRLVRPVDRGALWAKCAYLSHLVESRCGGSFLHTMDSFAQQHERLAKTQATLSKQTAAISALILKAREDMIEGKEK